MCIGLHVKYRLFLLDFNQSWIFRTDFSKNPQSIQWQPRCSMRTDRQTDRHDKAKSRFPQLCGRSWKSLSSSYDFFSILPLGFPLIPKLLQHLHLESLFTLYEETKFWTHTKQQIILQLCTFLFVICNYNILVFPNSFCSTFLKVKQTHYRPGQALRVPGGWSSQIWTQSTHEGGQAVSPTHRPP